jgi:glutamine amidotransferase
LRSKWCSAPQLDELFAEIDRLAAEIRQHGVFNFMLSNGEVLFAHCATNLHYIIRQAPFNKAHLVDDDVTVDFSAVTTPYDRVAW